MKMGWLSVAMVFGYLCFSSTQGVKLWKKETDYLDFTLFKSCFGDEAAVKLETETYKIGTICEEIGGTPFRSKFPTATQSRNKRSILKLPSNSSPEVTICNLRGLGLINNNDKIDFSVVEEALLSVRIDRALKNSLAEVLKGCRNQLTVQPDALPGDPNNELLKSLLTSAEYIPCLVIEGVRACMAYDRLKYFNHIPQDI